MKSIISPSGTFGGFNTVTIAADRYVTESGEYPFNVIGLPHSIGEWIPPVVPVVVIVPQMVTMRQARLALLQAGLLTAVTNAVNTAGDAAKIAWEYSSEVQRHNGLVPTMAAVLGMTETQIDNLFILAATL